MKSCASGFPIYTQQISALGVTPDEMAILSRREFVFMGVATLTLGSPVAAKTLSCLPKIGLLLRSGYPEFVTAFTIEMAQLGHVDGRSVEIETRLSKADLSDLPTQAEELARMDLALIVVSSLPQLLAVQKVNAEMPMVVVTSAALVESGFAKTRDRPGSNITGGDELPPGLTAKRMALLKRAAPKVSRIGILASPDNPPFDIQLADAKRAAVELGVEVTPYTVKSREAIEQALIDMVAKGMNGLVHFQSGLTLAHRQFIVDFAAQHRLPAIYQATRFVEAGGLMAWSPDQEEQFREAARFADKILRGARPGELAIRYPKKYFLTINAHAAKGLDLSLPADLFKEADRVIV